MRIAREIIETLKMELGFLRYRSTSLTFEAQIFAVQAHLQPSVNSLPLPALSLRISFCKDLHPVIYGAELNRESSVSIRGFTQIQKPEIPTQSLDFDVKLDSETICGSNLRFVDGLNFGEKGTNEFEVKLLNVNLGIENPIFHKIDTSFNLKTREVRCRIVNGQIALKSEPPVDTLYVMHRKPEDFVERDVILEVLKSLKTKYDISSLKFYGYYKHIPLEYAKMIRISSKGYLTVFFDPKMVKTGSPPGKFVNIVVFRYGDKFVYHVVGAM